MLVSLKNMVFLACDVAEKSAEGYGRRVVGWTAKVVVLTSITAVCAISGLICTLTALWIYAQSQVGSVGAPLIVAGVSFLLCGVLLMVLRSALMLRPRRPLTTVFPESALTEISGLFKENSGSSLMMAFLSGLAAGKSKK